MAASGPGTCRSAALGIFSLALLAGATAPALSAPIAYGITVLGDLITIDLSTGAGTLVGSTGFSFGPEALEQGAGGRLLAIENARFLYEVDPAAPGSPVLLGEVAPGVFRVEGLALDRGSSVLFGSANRDNLGDQRAEALIEIDPTNAAATYLGDFGSVNDVEALAVSSSGQLFGANNLPGQRSLVEIDGATGVATIVAGLSQSVLGLDFAPDGTLYATTGDSPSRLITIDPTNGNVTDIGAINFVGVTGLVIIPECSVALLLAIGLAGLAVRRRGLG